MDKILNKVCYTVVGCVFAYGISTWVATAGMSAIGILIGAMFRFSAFCIGSSMDVLVETVKPPPPPPTLLEKLLSIMLYYRDELLGLCQEHALIGITVLFTVAFLYIISWTRTTVVRRVRGIKTEAMVNGSEFGMGTKPTSQIPLYDMGIVYDSFIGYGNRIEDVLVLPAHVYAAAAHGLLIKEGNSKVLVSTPPIFSRINADVCYIPLDGKTWIGMLGVRNAKLANKDFTGLASCTGQKGTSYGYLSKNSYVGMLRYEGSTIPGMSGAAYMVAGQMHGMHIGCTSDKNLGVSVMVLKEEITRLFRGEAMSVKSDYSERNERILGEPRLRTKWNRQDLTDRIDQAFTEDEHSWSRRHEVDYDADLDWGIHGETKAHELLQQARGLNANQRILFSNMLLSEQMIGQNKEGTLMPIPSETVTVQFKRIVTERISSLEDRVLDLENKMAIMHTVPKSVHAFPCPKGCKKAGSQSAIKSYKTRQGLYAHILAVHPDANIGILSTENEIKQTKSSLNVEAKPLVGESAFPSDHEVLDNAAFLGHGKKTSPQTKKLQFSNPISSQSNSESTDIPTRVFQSKTVDTAQQTQKCLEQIARLIAGLNSGTTQNSKA